MDRTITYMEMTSPEQLRAGKTPPSPIEMVPASSTADALLLKSTYIGIGEPLGWSCSHWNEQQWDGWLARNNEWWVAYVDSRPAGLVMLESQDNHSVEIFVFGLVAEFVGRGFGGNALTLATQLAWNVKHDDGGPTERVWLHTSTRDHSNAMSNYLKRGFCVFDVKEVSS